MSFFKKEHVKAPEEFFYATLARVDRQSAIDLDKKVYMGKRFVYLHFIFMSKQILTDLFSDPDKYTTQGICPRHSNWNPDT